MLFKDDFSGWTKVYLVKSKSEADNFFVKLLLFLEATWSIKEWKLATPFELFYKKNLTCKISDGSFTGLLEPVQELTDPIFLTKKIGSTDVQDHNRDPELIHDQVQPM